MKVFSGSSNRPLAREIVDHLGIDMGKVAISRFSDGEIWIKYEENIRGEDVFVIQSTNPPAENILELILMIDAAVRASADRVTVVIPYYGYGRQDRKDQPRVPISARVMMDMMNSVGVGRILTMDLHSSQIQGFTNTPFDHLYAKQVIFERLRQMDILSDKTVILSPDVGSAPMAQSFARHLGVSFALIDKRRTGHHMSEVANLIGDLKDKLVILIDDMIDTAGTVINAAKAAEENGAQSVMVFATHGIFSGEANKKLMNSYINKVIVTNTLDIPEELKFEKLEIISVAKLFSNAIQCIYNGESISALFEF